MRSTRPTLAVLAGIAALALAACAPGALDPSPTTSDAPSVAPSSEAPTPDPSPSDFEPEPSVPPTTEPVGGDLELACDAVVTPDQIYAINPELLATASPAGGIPADLGAYADGGVVCAWQHVTSGDVLLVGVLRAADGTPAPVTVVPGRSAVVGDWLIAVASPYFDGAEADADALIAQVAGNLG